MIRGRLFLSSKKGQFFSYDAIVSVVIFLLAIGLLITYWWSVTGVMGLERERIQKEAISLSDVLLTPGNPSDWQTLSSSDRNELRQYGLTTGWANNVLDVDKIEQMHDWSDDDYDASKNELRLLNDYYIQIVDDNGNSACGSDCEIGAEPPAGVKQVVQASRVALLNDKVVQVKITLWSNVSYSG